MGISSIDLSDQAMQARQLAEITRGGHARSAQSSHGVGMSSMDWSAEALQARQLAEITRGGHARVAQSAHGLGNSRSAPSLSRVVHLPPVGRRGLARGLVSPFQHDEHGEESEQKSDFEGEARKGRLSRPARGGEKRGVDVNGLASAAYLHNVDLSLDSLGDGGRMRTMMRGSKLSRHREQDSSSTGPSRRTLTGIHGHSMSL